jgi:hypothetical protein
LQGLLKKSHSGKLGQTRAAGWDRRPFQAPIAGQGSGSYGSLVMMICPATDP